MPCDIISLGIEKINQIWREAELRAVGKKRAQTLVEAAKRSIGHTEGLDTARMEMSLLLEDYDRLQNKFKSLPDRPLLKTVQASTTASQGSVNEGESDSDICCLKQPYP